MARAGETGGVLDQALLRVADQLEKRGVAAPPGQVGDGLPDGRHRLRRLRAARARGLPGAGVRRRLQAVRRRPAGDHEVHRQPVEPRSPATGGACCSAIAVSVYGFRKWKRSPRGRGQWDAFRLRIPFKIGDIVQKIALARWSRTLSRADHRRRPAPAGAGDHRQDRGQHRRREGDGRRDRTPSRRGGTIAEPLKNASVFPAHGRPHGRRRRGDRRPRHDAHQGRRLLRGRGRRRGQGS